MELQTGSTLFLDWYDRNTVMRFIFEETSSLMFCVNIEANEVFKVSKQLLEVLGYDSDFEINDLNVVMDSKELKKYFDSIADSSLDKDNGIQVYLKTKSNYNIPVILKAKKTDDAGISFWLIEIKNKSNDEGFKILFENYPDVVFIHEPTGKILYANETAADYLGCKLEEIRGKKISNFGISIDFTVLEDTDDEISKLSLVSLLKNRDGEMHDVKIDSKLIEFDSEKYVMSVIKETTLFKQRYIEKRLLESSLGQILHFMNVGIIIFNEEGYITHISSNCESITGISGNAWNENAPFLVDKIIKEDFQIFRQNIEKVFKGEILRDIRIAFGNEAGNKKEVKGGFIPIVGDNGRVTEIILAIEEYGDEDASIRTLNFRNLVLNNAPIGIITFDLEGNYTFVNEEFLKLLGYEFTYEDVLKWNLYKLMDRDKILPGFIKAIEGETIDYTRDYMPTPSEQKFSFYQLFAPLKDKDGSIIGVLGLLNEITDKSIIPQNMIESEEKYREIFHLLEDPIILFRQTEKIADVNRCTFVLLGESVDSIVTKSFRDYFENIGEKEEDFFSNMHSLGEAYVKTNLKRFDDVIIPVTIYAKGLEISGFQYFVAIIKKANDSENDYKSTSMRLVDINQNINNEETAGEIIDLKQEESVTEKSQDEPLGVTESDIIFESNNETRTDNFINLFTIPVIKIGKDAVIKKINTGFTSAFDYNEDDVKNKYLSDIVTQDTEFIQKFLNESGQSYLLEQNEIFVRHKNQTLLNYAVFYLLVEDNDYLVLFRKKELSSLILSESDLSLECENKIQLMQSLTGRISSVYSLYIYLIQGYVSVLTEMKKTENTNKYKIEKLKSLTTEMESYTDKLLVFSQNKTLLTNEFDLLPLMNKVMSEHEQKYNFLKFENSVSNAYVNGNFEIFEIMLCDLLEYICGSVGVSGSVLVTVSIIENNGDGSLCIENYNKILLICIKERGYLIPEETLSGIFEPFVSSLSNNKSNIGLSFVYGVVKSLRGIIQVSKDTEYDCSIDIKIPVKTK